MNRTQFSHAKTPWFHTDHDQGGHIVARSLDGYGHADNVFPQDSAVTFFDLQHTYFFLDQRECLEPRRRNDSQIFARRPRKATGFGKTRRQTASVHKRTDRHAPSTCSNVASERSTVEHALRSRWLLDTERSKQGWSTEHEDLQDSTTWLWTTQNHLSTGSEKMIDKTPGPIQTYTSCLISLRRKCSCPSCLLCLASLDSYSSAFFSSTALFLLLLLSYFLNG